MQKLGATPSVLACVTEIVSAHLSNNAVAVADVPDFIRSIHAALREVEPGSGAGLGWSANDDGEHQRAVFHLADVQPISAGARNRAQRADHPPAVPVEASVQPGYIVCLEDGKRLRMLKRYLRTQFGMTPEDYRAKWQLPADYPMAAPEVVEQRRAHAKAAGLGRKPAAGRSRSGKAG